jgi:hypothetical protein|tara:strand:- start:6518 stop:6724 length:207 start_codon:yes stop_codon:yes gene_type:complete
MIKLGDPRITAKLLSHEDYRLHPTLPPKPKNRKNVKSWRLECQEIIRPTASHNSRLRKKIWLEMQNEE